METTQKPDGDAFSQESGKSLFELVGKYLQDADMNFNALTDEGYVGFIDGDNLVWQVIVGTDDESEYRLVQVTSILPFKVAAHTRNVIAELFVRMNCGMTIGSWDLEMDDGEMRFGINIDLMDGALTSLMFERMFSVSVSLVDDACPLILSVMHGGMKPSEAFTVLQAKRQDDNTLQ